MTKSNIKTVMFKSMSMTCLTLDKFLSLYLQFLNYKMRGKVSPGDGSGSRHIPELRVLWDRRRTWEYTRLFQKDAISGELNMQRLLS